MKKVDREVHLMKLFMTLLFVGTILTGCKESVDQPIERIDNFHLEHEITRLEVLEWETENLILEITDQAFIQELINELENAESLSTATMNFKGPDYKVLFLNEGKIIYELGYYNRAMNLGIIGRYWDYQQDGLYGARLKLPLDD